MLSLTQPWASLVVDGPKWLETRGWRVRRRRPPFRVGIHATREPYRGPWGEGLMEATLDLVGGDLTNYPGALTVSALIGSATVVDIMPIGGPTSFRTGTFEGDEGDFPGQTVVVQHPATPTLNLSAMLTIDGPDHGTRDITDQLDLGNFDPGRYAYSLYDRKPTTERCPWCWGERKLLGGVPGVPVKVCAKYTPCPVCWPRNDGGEMAFWDDGTAGRCEPIPMSGRLGLWDWTP